MKNQGQPVTILPMLELKLLTPFKNAPIFYKPETESTMIDARNLASQGFPSGTLVVAGYQISGRGRFPDRRWESPPDESFLGTLILRSQDFSSISGSLSLKAALSVATLLEDQFELSPAIKWPNDILLKGKKVAGILIECREQATLIGIGINCLQKNFPRELHSTATSIRKVTRRRSTVQDLISPLLTSIHRWFVGEKDSWKIEVENRLYLRNETVRFQPGLPGTVEPISGKLVGISDEGCILLQTTETGELQEFPAGEILFPAKR